MAIEPGFLDEIRARVAVSDVVATRVKLQRRGREHVGLCPFHNEKTPSFTVNDDKGFFHCFGCGAHGDVIGFSMRIDNLAFPDAVERLAGQAGLQVPVATPEAREREKQRASLYEVVEAAAVWFEGRLGGADGRGARDYLIGRGLEAEIMTQFRLGFAPDGGGLRQALAVQGIDDAHMLDAGLLAASERGSQPYERFRGRIIFPITDGRGRVIAFGGRAMGDVQPKYLNSPETPLFHKGHVLYGLDAARPAARSAGTVIVAEGYMDVIALHRAGYTHAVAPLGTALTPEQLTLLWRLAEEPLLCFDGDAAGMRAAERAAMRALPGLAPGRSLRLAMLPQGEDPDSLLAAKGPTALQAVFDAALPLAELLWRVARGGRDIDTPERRAGLEKRLMTDIAGEIGDATVRSHYRRFFSDRLYGLLDGRRGQVGGGRRREGRKPAPRHGGLGLGMVGAAERRESVLVATMLSHPDMLAAFGEEFAALALSSGDLDSLRAAILDIAAREPDLDFAMLRRHLTEHGHGGVVERLLGRGISVHAWSARPDASREDAEIGWRHTLARHHRAVSLAAEIKAAESDFAVETSEEGWARLQALVEERQSGEGDEADNDIYGLASGRVKSV